MKNSYKIALLAALGLASVTVAQAQLQTGDLVLGFTSQGAGVTQDYVVDLGSLPAFGSANVTLNPLSTTLLGSTFGANLANGAVNVGIVGGNSSGSYIYDSVLDGGTGTPTVAGSSAPATPPSKSGIASAAGTLGAVAGGVNAFAGNSDFTGNIAQSPAAVGTAANSFSSYIYDNPLTQIGAGAGSIVLDIYKDAASGKTGTTGWAYEGNVTINLSTGADTFDAVSVPEPTTYGLLAGAGLLAVSLRNKLSRKNA
jgi:hypothetical protein